MPATPDDLWSTAEGQEIRYRLPSYGQAVATRQRLYRWRKQLHEKTGSQRFSGIVLLLALPDGTEVKSKQDALGAKEVDILFTQQVAGQLLDAEGSALAPTKTTKEKFELDEDDQHNLSHILSRLDLGLE